MHEHPEATETSPVKHVDAGKATWWDIVYRCIFFLAVGALIFSFALGYYGYVWPVKVDLKTTAMNQWPTYLKLEALVLMGWVVIPPLFFWVEYFGIYRKTRHYNYGDVAPRDWEMFKYSQDVSAKVWIAVSTVLFILYFGKDIKLS